ncbi:MAG: zinc ribbon domain-containing protein, partial [Clostridia bacterium]|nr:zinc ribbon domain-containing protein [Clostridia bacterium]
MKFCPNCGEALEDEARFCPECGASAAAAEAAIEEAPIKEAVPAAEAEAPAEPRKKKSGVGKAIGIAALVILALLIAAAAVLYFTGLWQKLVPASRLKLGLAEKALVDRSLDDAFDKQNEPIRSALTD